MGRGAHLRGQQAEVLGTSRLVRAPWPSQALPPPARECALPREPGWLLAEAALPGLGTWNLSRGWCTKLSLFWALRDMLGAEARTSASRSFPRGQPLCRSHLPAGAEPRPYHEGSSLRSARLAWQGCGQGWGADEGAFSLVVRGREGWGRCSPAGHWWWWSPLSRVQGPLILPRACVSKPPGEGMEASQAGLLAESLEPISI